MLIVDIMKVTKAALHVSFGPSCFLVILHLASSYTLSQLSFLCLYEVGRTRVRGGAVGKVSLLG